MQDTRASQDIPLFIYSPTTASERRINPTWFISQFKAKMESVTGIPPSCQKLQLLLPGRDPVSMNEADHDATRLNYWNLQAYAEIKIEDTRPGGLSTVDPSATEVIPRYTMPTETYETLSDSVLAWKRTNQLGRFDPSHTDHERKKVESFHREVVERKIEVGKRCQIGKESDRRGTIAFIGEVPEIPGTSGPWVGVILDEPTGKNDGSLNGKVYFECDRSKGLFVRPDRVEIGDFVVLDDEADICEDEEEI